MTKFSLYIYIVPLLIPFQAITMEADWRYEKVVDKQLRKVYYGSVNKMGWVIVICTVFISLLN